MKHKEKLYFPIISFLLQIILFINPVLSQEHEVNQVIDEKVSKFLESRRNTWKDMNIPESDGKVLYDLIIKHKYKKALEIGTSTGHSAIWIAWALSKTGGKLITIEINENRYKQALSNFEKAGISDYIDARLADAHKLVPELEGPFDFVFCDADKNWYKNYLTAVLPKLEGGGCFTAHNVLNLRRNRGIKEFLDYVKNLEDFETTINKSSRSGISIIYKPSNKLEMARKALISYFSLLHDGRYSEAVSYYGGDYERLRDWNPVVEKNDYVTLFRNGCTGNGLHCLRIKNIVSEKQLSPVEFQFIVEFMKSDSSLFIVYGYGQDPEDTEKEKPPMTQFTFTVKKVNDTFLVQELPVYTP